MTEQSHVKPLPGTSGNGQCGYRAADEETIDWRRRHRRVPVMDELPAEALLDPFPPQMRSIAQRLRRLVLEIYPTARERTRSGWSLLAYDVPVAGRRKPRFAIWIAVERVHVHLGFQWGVLMDDPGRRLEGRGITKQVRWLTFVPGDPIRRRDLEPWIREAARVAAFSRGERLARSLDDEDAPTRPAR